ncbi:MAG: branched-chain amino acid transport system II carrier protein [Myxococcales bacterium]|nr:branched-chain amino acid transport system II carrier protein [Myxococcales bacterium]USN50622.1 MAG: branched-chain amino acid transport system II carrier protein [Myxococcales bacterium]
MDKIKQLFSANFFTAGLAMFAMFFGSGNLIFPVGVGRVAAEQNVWAMLGLFATAILLPFFGICLMLLYNGEQEQFFQKIGIIPGKLITFAILALIGPFGVLPRCIAFSYSTLSLYFESVNLASFAVVSCLLIFIFSYKENDVVGIIGNFLTPILLISLAIIIFNGLRADEIETLVDNKAAAWDMVRFGFLEGYKTFDVFAALFFASAVIPSFRNVLGEKINDKKSLLKLAVKSSVVGGLLLFSVYCGLSFVAANLRGALTGVAGDKLLGVIATLTMGKTAGLIANSIVFLACLTTAISLALVSAEYIKKEVCREKISYGRSLSITMGITLVMSLLGFDGIMRMIIPVLMVLYPATIILMIVSALNYFFAFPYIKIPFYTTLLCSLMITLFF